MEVRVREAIDLLQAGSAAPVSTRSKARAVPLRGLAGCGSFIYSLLLFILCLVFAEGCISRTHSLGPTIPWEVSLPSPARWWVK